MKADDWKTQVMVGAVSARTKFTVIMDGFAGSTPLEMITGAAWRGASPAARATEQEMYILSQAGRLEDVNWILNGRYLNPFR